MTPFIVSIHDVMPETLCDVDALIAELEEAGWLPATLLVVPGRDWTSAGIARLRRYADLGHPLAGHGWRHSVPRIRNLRHRIHSLLLSRRAAEHYALDALGVETLVRRCRQWFERNSLPAPELYVPPAWGLGPARPARLAQLGFRYIETLTGYYDGDLARHVCVPVIGFEADTPLRAAMLRLSNAASLRYARRAGAARLAIHPADLRHRLAGDLRALIGQRPATMPIADLASLSIAS